MVLLTLGDPARLTGGYLYHQRMAEAAGRHAARLTFVSLPERPFPLGVMDGPAALRAALRPRPDALVVDSIAAALLGPWLGLPLSRPPALAMLHQPPGGVEHAAPRTAVQGRLDRQAYRACRLLIVASELLRDRLIAAGVAPGRLRVVPPGRDVAPAPRSSLDVDLRGGRRCAFLCVANWVEHKGIHCVLDALARLPEDTGTLHLVGDDRADPRYAARLRERLARPDLAARVVVHGPLARDLVAVFYAAADVFVMTSFRETYGTVWGEAMAFGLPVVGWAAENLPYLADDGKEALLAPTGDVDALAAALGRLADDEPLRRRLGEAAARRAASRPTWEDAAGLFFGAIREAVTLSG